MSTSEQGPEPDHKPAEEIATAYPASTLVLLRPAVESFEVLLLLRAAEIEFAGGNWVFPGGRIEAGDAADGNPFTLAAAKIAALRECREEAGLELSTESTIYYSHWTTPSNIRKRFATWFVLDNLTTEQPVVIDDGEIVDYQWLSPRRALAAHRQGQLNMMPPTYITLLELSRCDSIAAARRFASEREPPQILPVATSHEGQFCALYPEDVAYQSKDLTLEGPRHRIIKKKNGWHYCSEF